MQQASLGVILLSSGVFASHKESRSVEMLLQVLPMTSSKNGTFSQTVGEGGIVGVAVDFCFFKLRIISVPWPRLFVFKEGFEEVLGDNEGGEESEGIELFEGSKLG